MHKKLIDELELMSIAEQLGRLLGGGDVIELIGDVGVGKTTFTRGLARGLGVGDAIQSPTFTISRVYAARDDLQLVHYDFYRLSDAGIMSEELEETIQNDSTVTVIEWGGVVAGVLPKQRITITIVADSEATRKIDIIATSDRLLSVIGKLV